MFDVLLKYDYLPISEKDIIQRVACQGKDIRLVDLNVVRKNYKELKDAFPYATAYAAVKANTSEGILEVLNEEGSNFEIATIEELEECIIRGIDPAKIIFTHPAKDQIEIEQAFERGITRFTSDSEEDLALIAKHAPGSKVMIRIKTENNDQARDQNILTGFNSRFGVTDAHAKELLRSAKTQGLKPYGLSFHVGTQEENVCAWNSTIQKAAKIFKDMATEGILLEALDIGGGLPSQYKESIPKISEYGEAIGRAINQHFDGNLPKEIMFEPGRAISAMAGVTIGRVINVKNHEYDASKYIVTVSTGKFSAGLFNVGNGMIFYRKKNDSEVEKISDEFSKQADIYGKACASFDKPIEGPDIYVPIGIQSGDLVAFTGTGAYSGEMVTKWCSKSPPTTITFDSQHREVLGEHTARIYEEQASLQQRVLPAKT